MDRIETRVSFPRVTSIFGAYTPLSSFNNKNPKLKTPFKTVFALLGMCTVFPISGKGCKTWYGVLLPVSFVLPSLVAPFLLDGSAVNYGNVATSVLVALFRLVLATRLDRLRGVARHVQQREVKTPPRWVYAWAAASTLLHLFLNACSVTAMNLMLAGEDGMMSTSSSLPVRIASSCYATVNVWFFVYPVAVFAFLYVLVCQRTEGILRDFAGSLRRRTRRDFGDLLASYRSIKETVRFVDHELSFLMFFSVLFSSLLMFMAVSLAMHPYERFVLPMKLAVYVYFVISLASFLAMTASASAVGEAAGRVAEAAEGLPEIGGHRRMGTVEQRFHMSAARAEMALTVWKIVPIRRNFIIGIYNRCIKILELNRMYTDNCAPFVTSFGMPSEQFPNYWKASLVFFGCGLSLMLFTFLTSVLGCCFRSIMKKSIFTISGTIQAIAGLFYILGLILYPVGWGSRRVHLICGDKSEPFSPGDCSLGLAFYLAIGSTLVTFICSVLSVQAEVSTSTDKVQDEILEGKTLICLM